jgi:hypothetical protein
MANDTGQGSDVPLARVKTRPQVRQKLLDIKAYIDEQRGNDPDDQTGWKVLQRIFHDLFYIRRWPYSSPQVVGLSHHYRKRRVGGSYMLYYFFDDTSTTLYVIELRHKSQRPLKPNTIRKYKRDIPED